MAKDSVTAVPNDGISIPQAEKAVENKSEVTVQITLPLAEATGTDVKVDQTENVVINGKVTQIRRGEPVDVKIPVFIQLKQRYPLI